ncbi:MAG: glycosyl transferase family 1 [Alphaproteobacteria bacterium]|nr:glycosyl transferase family 1 [Alphaproteobacteria bacterium]|tara:strand:- start:490 stop:2376 length:1887 start_codon:yes stop_codon:yes gene_type:complete
MLHINELTHGFGPRLIFNKVSTYIPKGHKVGVVGSNGTGKSTLFRLISREISPDSGNIKITGKYRLGLVSQEAPSGTKNLIDKVLEADEELVRLEAKALVATNPAEISEIQLRLTDIGAHSAKARAATILAGLGFSDELQKLPCDSFSGGWRMRVAIAATLFSRPDLLLLDEPTNHLDLEACMWLEGYLQKYVGTLLIISHDRALLNNSVENILLLENQNLKLFSGTYDSFEKIRTADNLRLQAKRKKQINERERIQSFVERFRAKATKARQAQSRIKKLSRMEPIEEICSNNEKKFNFTIKDELSSPLVAIESVDCGYNDVPVLRDLNISLDKEDRVALLGANGNGKSTLIKLVAGKIHPLSGAIHKNKKLRIGYFSQHQTEELNLNETAYQILKKHLLDQSELRIRSILGGFGFQGSRSDVCVRHLSGGEKATLLFCLLSQQQPHILLLDEPTNHLDIDARQALVTALNDYKGAIVLVSHDSHILDLVVDRLWLVDGGGCRDFDGDLNDYRKLTTGERTKNRVSNSKLQNKFRESKVTERRNRAYERKITASLRKDIKDAEIILENANTEVIALEKLLAKPEVYTGPTSDMLQLTEKLAEARKKLADAEVRWLAAEEKLNFDMGHK